jgi:hypothetical protein
MMLPSVYSALSGQLLHKFTTSRQAKGGAINAAMAASGMTPVPLRSLQKLPTEGV